MNSHLLKMSNADNGVIIRPATKDDMAAVAEMIQELADFEKVPDGPRLTVEDLQHDAFERQPPAFSCIVAEQPGKGFVGYALYFPTYSSWKGRSMLLEGLYVRPSMRGHGVGQLLFDAVAKEAVAIQPRGDCARLEFHVLKWNPARKFYDAKGSTNLTDDGDWLYYRLTGDALHQAASKAK